MRVGINAIVERLFDNLKHDWSLKVPQPTRDHIGIDEAELFMRHYNLERPHAANGTLSPIEHEQSVLT